MLRVTHSLFLEVSNHLFTPFERRHRDDGNKQQQYETHCPFSLLFSAHIYLSRFVKSFIHSLQLKKKKKAAKKEEEMEWGNGK